MKTKKILFVIMAILMLYWTMQAALAAVLYDQDFESNIQNWTNVGGGGSFAQDSAQAHTGTYSMHMNSTSSVNNKDIKTAIQSSGYVNVTYWYYWTGDIAIQFKLKDSLGTGTLIRHGADSKLYCYTDVGWSEIGTDLNQPDGWYEVTTIFNGSLGKQVVSSQGSSRTDCDFGSLGTVSTVIDELEMVNTDGTSKTGPIWVDDMLVIDEEGVPPVNASYVEVNVKNRWNSSTIQGANVTLSNGSSLLTDNVGNARFIEHEGTFNYTVTFPSFFNLTGSVAENTTSNELMFQNQVQIFVNELFTGNPISNFSIVVDGTTHINTTGNNGTLYPNIGNWTASVIDNTGQEDYHETNNLISVTGLENKTQNISVHAHFLNVTVTTIAGGATVNNFTVNITDLNLSTTRQETTTTGLVSFPVVHNTYNVTLIAAPGYAVTSPDGTFNATVTQTISADVVIDYDVYATRSVNFTFYDEAFPDTILIDTNITLSLINGGVQNYSTTNGTIFVSALTEGSIEARYSAPGFNDNFFFFTVTPNSTQTIDLYLVNSTITTLFRIGVVDQNDNEVVGATVRLQKQFLSMNGQFVTIGECTTDDDGFCYQNIEESISTIYRFIILIDGDAIKTTNPAPIITLSGEAKRITIRVDIGANLIEPLQQQLNVFSEIELGGNISNYTFVDGNNAILGGCLRVSNRTVPGGFFNVIEEQCVSGFNGFISYDYQSVFLNNTELLFEGFVNYTSSVAFLSVISDLNLVQGQNVDEDDRIMFTLIVFMVVSFASIFIPNFMAQTIINFGSMLGVVWLGLNLLGIPVIMMFMIVGWIVMWNRKNTRGQLQ